MVISSPYLVMLTTPRQVCKNQLEVGEGAKLEMIKEVSGLVLVFASRACGLLFVLLRSPVVFTQQRNGWCIHTCSSTTASVVSCLNMSRPFAFWHWFTCVWFIIYLHTVGQHSSSFGIRSSPLMMSCCVYHSVSVHTGSVLCCLCVADTAVFFFFNSSPLFPNIGLYSYPLETKLLYSITNWVPYFFSSLPFLSVLLLHLTFFCIYFHRSGLPTSEWRTVWTACCNSWACARGCVASRSSSPRPFPHPDFDFALGFC